MLRDEVTVQDIIAATEQILLSMAGVTFEQLANNREKQAAILYFIILIGEATGYLQNSGKLIHRLIGKAWQVCGIFWFINMTASIFKLCGMSFKPIYQNY